MEGNEFLKALRGGNFERVKQFIQKDRGVDKETALRCAAREGYLQVVQYLAQESDTLLNTTDYLGNTALMLAASKGHEKIVHFLIELCDEDLDVTNERGFTALMWAARNGHLGVARCLAEQEKVDKNVADECGYTALMWAGKFGHAAIVRVLVERGADVEVREKLGNTTLMIAAGRGHLDIVKYITEDCKADVNARNERGETATRIASDRQHHDIRRYLPKFNVPLPPQAFSSITAPENSSGATGNWPIHASEIEILYTCENENVGGTYRAKWLDLDVILKLFVPDASKLDFEKEVRLWQHLRHPNVIQLYGGVDAGPHAQSFVCEYASRGSLIEYVQASSVETPIMWKYLYEAALGLEYLHERGIVHGDLRCSNILIGSDGLAKLSNFSVRGTSERPALSGEVVPMLWQSPEVLEGKPPSFASDVYSLGMCILEAVMKGIPSNEESDFEVSPVNTFRFPDNNTDGCSPRNISGDDVREIVSRMCCCDPYKRASLLSVVVELESLAAQISSNVSQPGFDEFMDGKLKAVWMALQDYVEVCGNIQYHRVFDDMKRVHDGLQDSTLHQRLFKAFYILVTDFYQLVKMTPEQARTIRLSFTRATSISTYALQWRLKSLLAALGESTSDIIEEESSWQQQRGDQVEFFVSEVTNTFHLLQQQLKSTEERTAFLKTLKLEMEANQALYTLEQLAVMKNAYEDITSKLESDDLTELMPKWFIPWYELIVDDQSCLGNGGFGSVFRAKWLDSDVVVKRVHLPGSFNQSASGSLLSAPITFEPTAIANRAEALALFRHEAEIWFELNHPHIVRLFGACHVGRPFFVCEYATNGTLVSYLRANPDQLWLKLYEAALGVQYLHTRGLVHGDLKGNNIVVGSDMKAKVTDFGLSFICNSDAKPQISAAWHWLAPECLVGDDARPTVASDVYSLGMCIVEALRVVEAVTMGNTARICLPWGNQGNAVVKHHATRGTLPLRPVICDDDQWELVKRMCALHPKKRINIAIVIDELARMAKGETKHESDCINTSLTASLNSNSVLKVIASMQRLVTQRQDKLEGELSPVLLSYRTLWDRIEQVHGQIDSKCSATYQVSFCDLVIAVEKVTAKLQTPEISKILLAEVTLQCCRFSNRVDKFVAATRGDTLLLWSIVNGQIGDLRSIVEEDGVDVNTRFDNGCTALMKAAENGHTNVVQWLVDHGAIVTESDDFGDTALLIAAERGHIEVVRYLTESDVDVNIANNYGDTVLTKAIESGSLEMVRYIVGRSGAHVNEKNKCGDTALLKAIKCGSSEIVRYLVKHHGADVGVLDEDNNTVLMITSMCGYIEMTRYFSEKHNVDANARNKHGSTALMIAASVGQNEIVRHLAENCKADVNAADDHSNTALMMAAKNGHKPIVQFLAEKCDADVDARNSRGQTAIKLAADRGYSDIERILTPFIRHPPQRRAIPQPSSSPSYSIDPSEIELPSVFLESNVGSEYQAKWLDADAVVKLYIPDASHMTFENEVNLWQQLRHPDVIKIYGACGVGPHLRFFIYEYANRGSLVDLVELCSKQKPKIWKYLHEAALGLEYLHERRVIHGDLRCSNISIGSDGLAKLSNFKRSRLVTTSTVENSNNTWSIHWQSPEVLEGKPLSCASDVYCLGMCILEATTGEMPWRGESDEIVKKYKARWAPENNVIEDDCDPDCYSVDARKLVWRMCCQEPQKRVSLSSVVNELARLATKESSSVSQPEQEPPLRPEDWSSVQQMWANVQNSIKSYDNIQYHQVCKKLDVVHERLKGSPRATLIESFQGLLSELYQMMNMSAEQALSVQLSSTRSSNCIYSIERRIDLLLTALGESVDSDKERMEQWQKQRREQIELYISGVTDPDVVLKLLKTAEERAAFLKTLKAEIEDPLSKYKSEQLAAMQGVFDSILSTLETQDLENLTPEWFIPSYELIINELHLLGTGGFGRVNRAKWLDSNVVVKQLTLDELDNFPSTSVSSTSAPGLSALLAPSVPQEDKNERAERLEMFRDEVNIWFGFSHPHVVRLFGACHVGNPFFVCEYATNGTLVKYLQKHPEEVWSKLHEAALGVQHLHARGVVHGDLKGNNIVIGSDMKAKVTDFGLSLIAAKVELKFTATAAWYWVAPECEFTSTRPTLSSDVYSLGMCIVEALRVLEAMNTGRDTSYCMPWCEDEQLAHTYKRQGRLPTRPTVCTKNQWRLVERMCSLEPTERIKISTVVDELARMASSEGDHYDNALLPKSIISQPASEVISASQKQLSGLLGNFKGGDMASVLPFYTSLWGRLELVHDHINGKYSDECHAAFYKLLVEANAVTLKLQDTKTNLTSIAEATMRCYTLGRRLQKFKDAYFLVIESQEQKRSPEVNVQMTRGCGRLHQLLAVVFGFVRLLLANGDGTLLVRRNVEVAVLVVLVAVTLACYAVPTR